MMQAIGPELIKQKEQSLEDMSSEHLTATHQTMQNPSEG